jgi:hypothetical protein
MLYQEVKLVGGQRQVELHTESYRLRSALEVRFDPVANDLEHFVEEISAPQLAEVDIEESSSSNELQVRHLLHPKPGSFLCFGTPAPESHQEPMSPHRIWELGHSVNLHDLMTLPILEMEEQLEVAFALHSMRHSVDEALGLRRNWILASRKVCLGHCCSKQELALM